MAFSSRTSKALTISVATAAALALAACGAGKNDDDNTGSSGATNNGNPITVGTTDSVIALDPAGSYDFGSLTIEENIYQFLMQVPAGETAPAPDAAESCAFTKPTEYTCKMKAGLKFSNGDPTHRRGRRGSPSSASSTSPTRTARRRCSAA